MANPVDISRARILEIGGSYFKLEYPERTTSLWSMPRLPQEVLQQGVTVKTINPSILLVTSIYSPGGTFDSLFLNHYDFNRRSLAIVVADVGEKQAIGRLTARPD